jgi:hypothetical protein
MSDSDTERPIVGIGRERQFEVYVGGARGAYPRVPVSVEKLDQRARTAMTLEAYSYVAGGAGAAETNRANRAAFERWRLTTGLAGCASVRRISRPSVQPAG